MAVSAKELRVRIRSVGNLQKITRAMEMVAATKLRRLQDRAEGARPYADAIRRFSGRLATGAADIESPLTRAHESVNKIGLFVISSDRGLCGSYNSNLFKQLKRFTQAKADLQPQLMTVGRKARSFCKSRYDVYENFVDDVEKLDYRRARELGEQLTRYFMKGSANGGYDEIWLVYTRFASIAKQIPTAEKLLPIDAESLAAADGDEDAGGLDQDLILEPSPEALINQLLPKSISIRMYAAILDSLASEFAARRMAMKAATDAAGDMITDLRRVYNRARQEGITKELLDIVGGAEALS